VLLSTVLLRAPCCSAQPSRRPPPAARQGRSGAHRVPHVVN